MMEIINTERPMQEVEKELVLDGVADKVNQLGTADVVLGIPSFNNRETVERVVEAGVCAVTRLAAGHRVLIINSDGHSRDGTVEHLQKVVGDRAPLLQVEYPLYPVDRLSTPLAGVPGRKEAAFTIFRLARRLGARVCTLLDAGVESVSPDWVLRLTRPVLDGAVDLVVPVYLRGKLDGLVHRGMLSPFARALFGKRISQSAGTDLAFSAALMDFYIESVDSRQAKPGFIDPWSPISAIVSGFKVGQSFLGPRVAHSHVPPDLSSALTHLLEGLFEKTENSAAFWQKVRGSEAVPWFGHPPEPGGSDSEFKRGALIASFRQGCQDLAEIWNFVLPPATLMKLRQMQRQPEEQFRYPDDLWARTVYDFALGYHLRVMAREHLLPAITPLYLGWAASLAGEMREAGHAEVDNRLEQLSLGFEAEKKYLISRWRWPDRFSP